MFVGVEGCIGTGKTTLARMLAEHYLSQFLLEETKKHLFISDFYLDPARYAFQTEMNFILIHYHQLQLAQKEGLFERLVFTDFIFDKDRLFADLTLEDSEEQRLFTLTYDLLKQRVPGTGRADMPEGPDEVPFRANQEAGPGIRGPDVL